MDGRLALKAALVFCVAVGAGRLLLPGLAKAPAPKQGAAVAVDQGPAVQVSSPRQATVRDSDIKTPPKRAVDRTLTAVTGGARNENTRLTHYLATDYAEGTVHTAARQFGAMVKWVPGRQELLRGDLPVAVAEANSVRGELVKAGARTQMQYSGTYPDTDERMHVRPDGGLEHDIILARPPQVGDDGYGLAYTGRLLLSPGLTLWDGKQQITGPYTTKKGIHIKNVHGNTVFHLRHPYAYDAAVTKADGCLDVEKQAEEEYRKCEVTCEYRVDFDEAGVKLAVVTPGDWLSDPQRSYPVVIDPNLGPFGLADGDPPIYVGTAGSDTLIPANAGGQRMAVTLQCPTKPDNGAGIIPMPFAFEYYGTVYPVNASLYVHIDGFASFDAATAAQTCNDTDNTPIPTAGYPDNAFFPYWDDLRFSTTTGSGIYWFVDGVAPSRRLVIEWFKMGYSRGNSTDQISFNLVLFECDNKIELIIGQTDEVDVGMCSVGIEDPTGMIGIQYDFNSALAGAFNPNQGVFNPFLGGFDPFGLGGGFGGLGGGFGGLGGFGGTTGNTGGTATPGTGNVGDPITPGTAVTFERSALGFLTVGFTPLTGCIPHTVCFDSAITPAASTCAGSDTVPSTFSFHWLFGDSSEGFTPRICHTWVRPGTYGVVMTITDEFGTTANINFDVRICDVPQVVIIADPQGGTVPLNVDAEARALSTSVQITSPVTWTLDRLGTNNQPGQFLSLGVWQGSPTSLRLDSPGLYRLSAIFQGTDALSGLPTAGIGTVFLFVAAPTDIIEDSIVITESQFVIDWVGKRDGFDADGLPPSNGSTAPGLGFPDNPENDTMSVRGYLSLRGAQMSDLANRVVRIVLNGVDTIFEGVLDASGKATLAANDQGRIGQFQIKLPSGQFWLSVRRSLYVQLGLSDATEQKLLPAHFSIGIDGLYPPPGSPGALITYGYRSKAFTAGPPALGSGVGVYRFGAFTGQGAIQAGFGRPGGQEVLLTGAFMVLDAKLKLEGNSVFADLKGKLARYGGDDLRPRDQSDVAVSLGNFTENLNFTATGGFRARGKPPAQSFTFKRPKMLGQTGIAALQWKNQAGDFRIKTYGLPNELVGLNPSLGIQTLTLGLVITPDGAQVYNGVSQFDVTKKSATEFVRKAR